jgi:hypothetical protein
MVLSVLKKIFYTNTNQCAIPPEMPLEECPLCQRCAYASYLFSVYQVITMGNKLKINTDDLNLRDLLGNGKKYRVPKFQRDYSWGQEQWQDLWEDIEFIQYPI